MRNKKGCASGLFRSPDSGTCEMCLDDVDLCPPGSDKKYEFPDTDFRYCMRHSSYELCNESYCDRMTGWAEFGGNYGDWHGNCKICDWQCEQEPATQAANAEQKRADAESKRRKEAQEKARRHEDWC